MGVARNRRTNKTGSRAVPRASSAARDGDPAGNGADVTGSAADFIPTRRSLTSLREAAAECRGCEVYTRGTQTVFGEGRRAASLILVGEQPGDQEDLQGRPFGGPAGRLLDQALEEAGIDREAAYVTNLVKHFKWEP